ncbi:lipoprotein BA_5634 family protein, partial [Bacillus wiedmannii]|uniref:lipoprotein BA_5634 family protein n=1 Tax=Bacillus wiedmannii TaxID=1890302 RepID=UPI000BEC665A
NETTAKKLTRKGLLKHVGTDNSVKLLERLPAISEQQGILFAKKEVHNSTINGHKLVYQGNVVIGDLRLYGDMYAVVTDNYYKKMKMPEKTMGILQFTKNPINELPRKIFDVEETQLVKVKT